MKGGVAFSFFEFLFLSLWGLYRCFQHFSSSRYFCSNQGVLASNNKIAEERVQHLTILSMEGPPLGTHHGRPGNLNPVKSTKVALC